MSELVLASASPRRRDILSQVGWSFQTQVPRVVEHLSPLMHPEAAVQRVAADKARSVARHWDRGLVLAADTVVQKGQSLLGKPDTGDHARAMLQELQGTWHLVITGVALLDSSDSSLVTGAETTEVKMRPLAAGEIGSYVETGEPLDKAGAYGIQGKGALLVECIRGCYYNVVGLPLALVVRLLQERGLDVWKDFGEKG